jgi:hypothetical protein
MKMKAPNLKRGNHNQINLKYESTKIVKKIEKR